APRGPAPDPCHLPDSRTYQSFGCRPSERLLPNRPDRTVILVQVAAGTGRAARVVAPKERPRPEPVSRYGDIVDVAAELFATKGYAATSIQDIADAVGILKGSLYHYINTKEDLLVSVVDEVHRHTGETIEAVGTVDGDAAVKLAVFVEWHLAPTDHDVAKARVFFSEFAHVSPERAGAVQR